MKKNEQDRRILKTRQAIQEALFSLMAEKQYSKIIIQDIIDKANVGRSTFYSHFATKDELLLSCMEPLLETVNEFVISYVENTGDKSNTISIVELFEHVKKNGRILKGLFKAENSDLFFEKLQADFNCKIKKYLNSKLINGKETKVPIVILTNHISSTLIYLLKWWSNNNMIYSPSQMNQYFQELISPCIDSIMSS